MQIHAMIFFSVNAYQTHGSGKSKSGRKMLESSKNQLNYELSKVTLCV